LTSIPIILCCFTSGLVDANVFNAWGVFASMQTGNTVILALGASSLPRNQPHLWLQALTAIAFYFIGSFVTCRLFGMLLHPLKRHSLGLSFLLQAVLICVAAALVQGRVVPGLKEHGTENLKQTIPLAMLAFQAGQQSVASRELGLNEIPTTVLTSVYCDLGNDHNLFAPLLENWKRNRRFLAAVALLCGAIIGGWLSRTSEGMAAGLWMAGGMKVAMAVAFGFWKAEKESGGEGKV